MCRIFNLIGIAPRFLGVLFFMLTISRKNTANEHSKVKRIRFNTLLIKDGAVLNFWQPIVIDKNKAKFEQEKVHAKKRFMTEPVSRGRTF